jgi:hypothetical protein
MSEAPIQIHPGPTETERGKLVVQAAKALKAFRTDTTITTELYASWQAGRMGLLAAALRNQGLISLERFHILAGAELFSPPECRTTVLPALEQRGLVDVRRKDGTVEQVESIVLTYDGMLEAIADIYDGAEPTVVDRACCRILHEVSRIPAYESDILGLVADEFDEATARRAIGIARSYRIVAEQRRGGEPLLYSERVWSGSAKRASRAMASLDRTDREVLAALVEEVRTHQGVPEAAVRHDAAQHNAVRLLDLAIGIGLLSRTEITMADRSRRAFLTSPHFYADVGSELGDDACDRVKIFLDSIRNGQHFGRSGTGRITDPDRLLTKLLNNGEIGPCTAIGTDYITPEKGGIIRVRPSSLRPGQFFMKLLQRDTVEKVHSIVTTGAVHTAQIMNASDIVDGVQFRSVEELRPDPGQVPVPVAELEREIIRRLREN